MNQPTYYHPSCGTDTVPRPTATDHPVMCGGGAGYWGTGPGCGEVIEEIPLTKWGRGELDGTNVDALPVTVR
jgi:hypothetical protein